MKSKLGNFSNANALLVSFGFTHKQLITAQAIAPDSLRILGGEKGKDVEFRVANTSNATASRDGAFFPFVNENEDRNVEVLFLVEGGDTTTIKYNAASIIKRLAIVEDQVVSALTDMQETADEIEMLTFEDESAKPGKSK